MAGTKYPVILTSHMQEAIEGGAWIEVECVEAPEKGGNTHRGGWTVFVCSNDGQGGVHRSVYVTNRDLQDRSRAHELLPGARRKGIQLPSPRR